METIGLIASLVAAFAAVATLVFTVRTSKWSIRRRIERKQRRIHYIDDYQFRKYGSNKMLIHPAMTKMDLQKSKLQDDIEELRKDL